MLHTVLDVNPAALSIINQWEWSTPCGQESIRATAPKAAIEAEVTQMDALSSRAIAIIAA